MTAPSRGLLALLCSGAVLTAVGCGREPETPEQALADLADKLRPKARDGWKVGRVRDVFFPVLEERVDVGDLHPYREAADPNDVIVWRAGPVRLQARSDGSVPDAKPGHVYFVLSRKALIPPENYRAVCGNNDEALRQRKWLVRDVAHVARDADGKLSPRGAAEAVQVAAFGAKYDKLPPYDAFLPQYRYACVGIRFRDYRTVLVPLAKDHRQEMNQTYVEIAQVLAAYGQ